MPTLRPKQILIAPLDWGLGHTARCIPLIRCIMALGHIPIVAGNESQHSFITETFGAIDFIHLDGYNITYSQWNRFAQAGVLSQLPQIYKTIKKEHQWLLQLCRRMHIDGIISDNRYGLFHPGIPSVILTHQLMVQTGMGAIIDRAVQKLHYRRLNRFGSTWVVDASGIPNLAGRLSHTNKLPPRSKYIGLLSRFEEGAKNNFTDGNMVILLSGPEPQRTILSQILWQQVQSYNGKVTFIEGSDIAPPPKVIPKHITRYSRLTGQQLAPILQSAEIVICRSGYSTIMDLVALGKKAILIPTPGQTEQEYLARHLQAQGIFYFQRQHGFNLKGALRESLQFPYHPLTIQDAFITYKKTLAQWLDGL